MVFTNTSQSDPDREAVSGDTYRQGDAMKHLALLASPSTRDRHSDYLLDETINEAMTFVPGRLLLVEGRGGRRDGFSYPRSFRRVTR